AAGGPVRGPGWGTPRDHLGLGVSLSPLSGGFGLLNNHAGVGRAHRARRTAPKARGNPWRAHPIEWQVPAPPPVFNFDKVPTVVGGPYEYGIPGAVHGIFESPAEARPKQPAGASTPEREEER